MSAPVKGPLALGPENCGGGINLHAVVDGQGVVIAWTTRCVIGGREVVSDAQAKATAGAIALRYNVHDTLLEALETFIRLGTMNDQKAIDSARAAIAKARGVK